MGGGRGPQRNQPKMILRNHSWLLDSIVQAQAQNVHSNVMNEFP